jgi:hypothetical protein
MYMKTISTQKSINESVSRPSTLRERFEAWKGRFCAAIVMDHQDWWEVPQEEFVRGALRDPRAE